MMGEFGDRMKSYEKVESGRRFMPLLPVLARLDGKCFHTFTRGLERPYDERFSMLMQRSTARLVKETQAKMGYTQSDEITLAWYSDKHESQIFFDGRVQKMTSVLASMATWYFSVLVRDHLPEKVGNLALFDCRVWQVPTLWEAANAFLWREMDATKNSIAMAAQHYHSHNELQGKNGAEMQEMLHEKGVNWNDYPAFFKRGTFVQRYKMRRRFTATELNSLPEKHEARLNSELTVERSGVRYLEMPPFTQVTNRVDVIFNGVKPETEETCQKKRC